MVLSGEDAAFFLWSQENRLTVRNVPYIENICRILAKICSDSAKKKIVGFCRILVSKRILKEISIFLFAQKLLRIFSHEIS